MAYAASIAQQSQRTRTILRFEGVPYYFTDDATLATWSDSVTGVTSTHGTQTALPIINSISTSGGELDFRAHRITSTTLAIELQDCTELHTLFARRLTGAACYSDVTKTQTDIDVDNPAPLVTGYAYLGRETVNISAIQSNTLTTSRAALGTTAVAHPGGTIIAMAPQYWIRRRVTVIGGSYPDPTTGGWVYGVIGTYLFDSSPGYSAGRWSLSAAAGLEMFDRPVYTGFSDTQVVRVSYDLATQQVKLELENPTAFVNSADYARQIPGIWIEGSGGTACFRVASFTSPRVYADARLYDVLNGDRNLWQFLRDCGVPQVDVSAGSSSFPVSGISCRSVYPQTSGMGAHNPASIALRIMLSDFGGGTNHGAHDWMPGVDGTETAGRTRAGAGLTTADVDVAAWSAARVHAFPSGKYIVGAVKDEKLSDILCSDVAPVLGGYVFVNAAGQISFRRYTPATVASSAALVITDANDFASDNIAGDEKLIVSHVKVWCDYDWAAGEWRTQDIAHYTNADHIYGDLATLVEIKSRLAAHEYQAVKTYFQAIAQRFAKGPRAIAATAPWAGSALVPGDLVRLTNTRLPPLTSATLGITSMWCEVVRVAPDWDRRIVAVDLLEMPSAQLLAPSMSITNADADELVVAMLSGVGAPNTECAVGWPAAVFSLTGTLRGTTTIAGLTATTCTLTARPAGTVATDVIILDDWSEVGGGTYTQQNTINGATPAEYFYLSSTASAPVGAKYRWG